MPGKHSLPILALGGLLTAACQGGPPSPEGPADLRSIEEFGELFDAHQGSPRLVLLLSPT